MKTEIEETPAVMNLNAKDVIEPVPLGSNDGVAHGVRLGRGDLRVGLVKMSDASVVMRFSKSDDIVATGTVREPRPGDEFQPGDLLIKVGSRESAIVLLEVVARLLAEFPIIAESKTTAE